ncbi:MAG: 6-phosphofructokinase [Bacteroidetes bacterium]|nr:6-phosphofructokinase [Bacteroidota bacterium]
MKKIALFTSGGDSPGMNACIRAVVRSGIFKGLEVTGITHGYEGMIEGKFIPMKSESVSGIIQRGGTILKTARSKRFMTAEGMKLAYENLSREKIDGVIAIGGDGTFRGALEFNRTYDIPFIGIPGTIDNDLVGTDFTLGFDTAINTVVEAVDKIRDTAASHDRLFFVEVMGRDAGSIALLSGISVGAEAILIPETKTHVDRLINTLKKGWHRNKTSMIVIVAEGEEAGGAYQIAELVKKQFTSIETRVTVLGHIQRGGNPTCNDRVLASRLGVAAVEAMMEGRREVMAGLINNEISFTPFSQAVKQHIINQNLLKIAEILSL